MAWKGNKKTCNKGSNRVVQEKENMAEAKIIFPKKYRRNIGEQPLKKRQINVEYR